MNIRQIGSFFGLSAITGALLLSASPARASGLAQIDPAKRFTITVTNLNCELQQEADDEPYVVIDAIEPANPGPYRLDQRRSAFFTGVDDNNQGDDRAVNIVLMNNESIADNGLAEDGVAIVAQVMERDRTTSGAQDKEVVPAQAAALDAFQDAISRGETRLLVLSNTVATALKNSFAEGSALANDDDPIGSPLQFIFTEAQLNGLPVNVPLDVTLQASGAGAKYNLTVTVVRTQ